MPTFCRRSDEPDPDQQTTTPRLVDSADAALATILGAVHQPARPEVIVVLLTPDFVGHTVLIVDGTTSPDAVVEVIELVAETAAEAGREHAIVVATVRPGEGPLPGDVDRWSELSDLAETHGCELVEWFVISDDVAWCPRDFLVEPPRWPARLGSESDPAT